MGINAASKINATSIARVTDSGGVAGQTSNYVGRRHLHPLPLLRIPEPVVIHSQRSSFFSGKETPEDALCVIENIWKSERLFSHSNDPNSSFYTEYLKSLAKLVNQNYSYFLKLNTRRAGTTFEEEVISLIHRPDFTELQKAVCLTKTVEMAFMGIDQTPVLRNINSTKIPKSYLGVERFHEPIDVRKQGRISGGGFFQEIESGWFLAKVIYQLDPSLANLDNFVHSQEHSTIKRTRKKNKKIEELYPKQQRVMKEVDISTNDALISVKSNDSHYDEQIANLFFIVIDDNSLNFAERIKKIILIRCAEKPYQYSPNYQSSREYCQTIKPEAIESAREFIRKYGSLNSADEKLLDRLVSRHGIEIYFIPSTKDVENLRLWIRLCYEFMDANK